MMITVSIVSHGQMAMVRELLSDIQKECQSESLQVILTQNTQDETVEDFSSYSFPVLLIKNQSPKGFGYNHNQAFRSCKGDIFCIVNPDVRLVHNPFHALVECLQSDEIGLSAPVVLNSEGCIDNSARNFPSPKEILFKAIGFDCCNSHGLGDEVVYPDWVAGMFMVFRAETYQMLNGFDERYFLYYEDVDICARLTYLGKKVMLCPSAQVIHLAQRASHRNLKYLRFHVTSMFRYFLSLAYWRMLWR